MNYVAGLLFDSPGHFVVLMEKIKPEWQAGKLNAFGGKIEAGETPLEAMHRESIEEIGVTAPWDHFLFLNGNGWQVYFYSAFNLAAYNGADAQEGEKVSRHHVKALPANCVPNIHWIIPMALTHYHNGMTQPYCTTEGVF